MTDTDLLNHLIKDGNRIVEVRRPEGTRYMCRSWSFCVLMTDCGVHRTYATPRAAIEAHIKGDK